jgi:uncharacterized protein YbaR (Trm112 family)
MSLDPQLLEILACPACDSRPPVRQEGDWLVCDVCNAAIRSAMEYR